MSYPDLGRKAVTDWYGGAVQTADEAGPWAADVALYLDDISDEAGNVAALTVGVAGVERGSGLESLRYVGVNLNVDECRTLLQRLRVILGGAA